MNARDVMVSPVITIKPSATVSEVARLLLDHHISAVPVVDDDGKLVGIVSEGDLVRRAETGTERRRSWWLSLLTDNEKLASEYVKAHARKVMDVMTQEVITAEAETPLEKIASLMERNSVKRIPVLRDGRPIGIVSRANLVQALAGAGKGLAVPLTDTQIRDSLIVHLKAQPWAHTSLLNVTVTDGVVDLWGVTASDAERQAIRVAAEAMAGVRAVNDNLFTQPPHIIGM